MADRVCTRFKDTDGLDLGCHLVTKEYLLEAYPSLVPWMQAPALWLWGYGRCGRLGNSCNVAQSSPVQTISGGNNWRSVSARDCTTTAIKTDGTLWLWGDGSVGAMGDNSIANQSSPVQTISGGTNWRSVSAGRLNVAAIKTDGTLWLWGRNCPSPTLGTNSIINQSSPVQTISGGTNWKSVFGGYEHTAAIKTDGTLWMWGNGNGGLLGTNSNISRSSPVQTISGGTNWKSVSLAGDHTGGVKTDGTLWLWGAGNNGRLGNNSTIIQSSPVQTISGGTNWRSVSVGDAHTAAIKTDGTLWLWGDGLCGRLGNNSTITQSSPVQTISGGTSWRSVSAGFRSTAAIKTDGTLWLWGYGRCGRLGNNSNTSQSSPVQTISGGNNWRSVCTRDDHTAAIRDEGEY